MSFGSESLDPPTADEKRRWDMLEDQNRCICCGAWGIQRHHLLSGDVRIGHLYTIALCLVCHSNVKRKWFKTHYGDNQALFDRQNKAIGWPLSAIPNRRRRRGSTDRPAKMLPRLH